MAVTICLSFCTISMPITSPVKAVFIQSNKKKEAPKSTFIKKLLEILITSALITDYFTPSMYYALIY